MNLAIVLIPAYLLCHELWQSIFKKMKSFVHFFGQDIAVFGQFFFYCPPKKVFLGQLFPVILLLNSCYAMAIK